MSTDVISAIAKGIGPVFEPLTVQQYHTMISGGILKEGSPIELIDGLLVRKDRRDQGGDIITVGTRHPKTVKRLERELNAALSGTKFHGQTQQPITLNGLSEPEPDGCIIRGTLDDFASHHPGPAEVAVVIEVADSSLEYDRTTKLAMYAVAGIPVYWIVNLQDDVIEVHTVPSPAKELYDGKYDVRPGDSVEVDLGSQRVVIDVDALIR